MGYVDRFYFGQAKLIVETNDAGTVEVTDGKRTWTAIVIDGSAIFTLPGTNRYTVKVNDSTNEVYLSYGDCQSLDMNQEWFSDSDTPKV